MSHNRRHSMLRHRSVLASNEQDPLEGVSNLFDVAMVFSVALLIGMVGRVFRGASLMRMSITDVVNRFPDNAPDVAQHIDRYRIADQELSGNGYRLGVAYQLPTGEVVYIPDSTPP
ncbi:MAG: DUF2149 domain-containing protein [Planctomycetota bacterium]|nr:MAG: DUF2149 domain-containing protein [Planctomycetota bacterium]